MIEPLPDHLRRPRVRPVEAFPVRHEGETWFGLRDPRGIAEDTLLVSPAVIEVLRHFDGTTDLDELGTGHASASAGVRDLAVALDRALLLEGPTFEEALAAQRSVFADLHRLPIRAAVEHDAATLDRLLDEADAEAGGRQVGDASDVAGLVAPHLDLGRGGPNYAAAWARLRRGPRPDRVVVLGTNHFGASTGVLLATRGWETAHGPLDLDSAWTDALADRLGPAATAEELDHLREHSLELQMPWIRHLLGPVPVVGALVHDPLVAEGASYDGQGVDLDAFIDALADLLEGARRNGERVLLVASADLSHVGPEFGDEQPNSRSILDDVERHDRDHLDRLLAGEVDGFLDSMHRARNRTRWCTIGAMTALWRLLPAARPRLLRYAPALDRPEDGACCVTSAAIVLEEAEAHP